MLIAIPSVTNYINNSRKEGYIDTAKELIKGATVLVNSGELDIFDTDTTYYIPNTCINVETGGKSPYGGDFAPAYILVTYNNDSYTYYWISRDEQSMGIKKVTMSNKLNTDLIEAGVKTSDVSPKYGIDGRSKIVVFNADCSSHDDPIPVEDMISGDTGDEYKLVCKRATVLHEETCQRSDGNGCNKYDNHSNNSTFTYGNLGSSGSLAVGDAFDCDVNGDDNYNSTSERFYYVTSSGNNAVLMYYNFVSQGDVINSTNGSNYCAYFNGLNTNGPVDLLDDLPSINTWSNVRLSNSNRRIVDFNGTFVTNFDYSDRAARLVTADEIKSACNINVEGYNSFSLNSVKKCEFIFEKTNYIKSGSVTTDNWWLETTYTDSENIKVIDTTSLIFNTRKCNYAELGIRPVIEVPLANIKY